MKSRITTLCAVLFCISALSAQSVKKIKYASEDGTHEEMFVVLKKYPQIMHGEYEEKYRNVVITRGEYEIGEQAGTWEFSSYDGSLNFSGVYKEDRKDGYWPYYRNDTLISELFFSNGMIDSIYSYYDMDKLACEQRMDSSGTGDTFIYYENGVIREHSPLENREIDGTVTLRFENGDLFRRVQFRNGQPYEVLNTYKKDGEPLNGGTLKDGSGTYLRYGYAEAGKLSFPTEYITYSNGERNGPYIKYSTGGGIIVQGEYIDGKKSGTWMKIAEDGNLTMKEHSIDAEVNEEDEFSEDHLKTAGGGSSLGKRYATFQSGEEGLMEFLASNVHYPEDAKNQGVSGTVYITFTVDEDGFISRPEILSSVYKSLDVECMRIVLLLPRWNPGFQNGIPARVRYNLPVRFKFR